MFVQTIVDLKSPEDAKIFLNHFFTETEVDMFAKRLAVGYWLKKERSYANIKDNLKVSSATIASIQDMLKKQGFKKAIKNLEADEWANQWTARIKKLMGNRS